MIARLPLLNHSGQPFTLWLAKKKTDFDAIRAVVKVKSLPTAHLVKDDFRHVAFVEFDLLSDGGQRH